jgi:hypothetical protein
MKIINEKGKLFGLVNLVDLLVAAAIVLAAVGIAYKIFAAPVAEAVSPKQDVVFTCRVRALYPRAMAEIEKSVGEKLVAGNAYVEDAVLESVAFEPYVMQVPTADGRIVDAEDPSRVDAVFTVRAKVTRDAPILKTGTQEFRVGMGHFLKTKYIEFSTTVESITMGD